MSSTLGATVGGGRAFDEAAQRAGPARRPSIEPSGARTIWNLLVLAWRGCCHRSRFPQVLRVSSRRNRFDRSPIYLISDLIPDDPPAHQRMQGACSRRSARSASNSRGEEAPPTPARPRRRGGARPTSNAQGGTCSATTAQRRRTRGDPVPDGVVVDPQLAGDRRGQNGGLPTCRRDPGG
jgi:hypothetical protein